MNKREFKAMIVDNFKERWFEEACEDEGADRANVERRYGGKDFDSFAKRVSGKCVILVEHKYENGYSYFLEKEDGNFVIPKCLFERVEDV